MEQNMRSGKQLRWNEPLAAVILLVLIVAVAAGVMLYQSWDADRVEMNPFAKTYTGLYWMLEDEDPGKTVTVSFDGRRNALGAFEGDIRITSGGEELCFWENCTISKHTLFDAPYAYDVVMAGAGGPSHDSSNPTCHAILYINEDWTEFTFHLDNLPGQTGGSYSEDTPLVTVGATTVQEAQELTARLAEGSFYQDIYKYR